MKATDEMKMYLNSIINKIDADIHNELWNKLIAVIAENEQLKNCNLQNVSQQRELLLAFAEHCQKDMFRSDRISTKEQLVEDFLKANNCG